MEVELIVAIPLLGHTVAPCFETAGFFLIAVVETGRDVESRSEACSGCKGFGRVRLLQDNKVNALVCGGIKRFYRDLLEASGISVIQGVSMLPRDALSQFLAGRLHAEESRSVSGIPSGEIPHEDLVCWAKELFDTHGYSVVAGRDRAPFPIDLIAEMTCPVCNKQIKVAICCGAHIYRADKEIREFHYAVRSDYDGQVYVHPATPGISQHCEEYGIELIDPETELANSHKHSGKRIPILQKPVAGHEKAFDEG
jgi:predicted Fe-Mo cluster-binding NifX family protein